MRWFLTAIEEVSLTRVRVKALESQISELEAEASRLLRALDTVKDAKAEVERTDKKKADDAAKEIATQASEIESLRTRVKQFSDYDDIKRELEIMKVSFRIPSQSSKLMSSSMSSFPEQTLRGKTMYTYPIQMQTKQTNNSVDPSKICSSQKTVAYSKI